MIILDRPYVSEFLAKTISELDLPVLQNNAAEEFMLGEEIRLLKEEEFINRIRENSPFLLYSNSENSINWIQNNLGFTDLPDKINLFKDKVKFRNLLKQIYPDFYYSEVGLTELENLDISKLSLPFIIKPSIGFFSMGVYKVSTYQEWQTVVQRLNNEISQIKEKYPVEVIDLTKFIIEEIIEGDEFAIDVYYSNTGKPVILNIFKHIFSSREDVSDRIYITSKDIIESYHDVFQKMLVSMGELIELRNFPMHVEYRIDKENRVFPIEVNPMRFAGWCTTDIAYYAYGINVYDYFFKQKEPDWQNILKDKQDKIYSIVVADLPKDVRAEDVQSVDYDLFLSKFENPLALRKMNYRKHPVFAFLFTETQAGNWNELERMLKSDMKEFLELNR